jgi:hypothetical protein
VKSTDIPNGAVVRGRGGRTVLLDFDDAGTPEEIGTELEPMDSFPKGVPANIVVLVHSVKGEKRMLLRSLATIMVATKDGKPAAAADLEKRGELLPFVASLRQAYIERAQSKEVDDKK